MTRLVEQGGPVLVAILALSAFAWTLLVWKWLELRVAAADAGGAADEAVDHARAGDLPHAREAAQAARGAAGRLLAEGLASPRPADFFARLDPVLRHEASVLRRHLPLLAVLGNTALLLGLLGTILGMVRTFDALAQDPSRLAGGIREALLTTQAGLVTALPVVVLHGYLVKLARRSIEQAQLYGKRAGAALGEA